MRRFSFIFFLLNFLFTSTDQIYCNTPHESLEQKNITDIAGDLIRNNKHQEAIEILIEPAENGNAEAQYLLGISHRKNDIKNAVYWLEQAAFQGNIKAQSCLGNIYQNGRGVRKDPLASLFWLSKAAWNGDRKAIQLLSEVFSPFNELYSVDFPKNEIKNWKLGFQQRSENEYVLEYVPLNENVENWSQLITVQFTSKRIADKNKTALTAAAAYENFIIKKYGDQSKFHIVQPMENDVVYESFIPRDKETRSEHEIVRLIKTSEGFYRLSYAKRESYMDEETKEIWLHCLQESNLIKLN